jgi:uncharacterized metal-binding protein (TIGR02443 family)
VTRPAPKRFIAGAVCPRCAAQDRVVVFPEGERQRRECVECGFTDLLPDPDAGDVPRGRLDTPRPKPADGAQPIRFYPRPKKKPDG